MTCHRRSPARTRPGTPMRGNPPPARPPAPRRPPLANLLRYGGTHGKRADQRGDPRRERRPARDREPARLAGPGGARAERRRPRSGGTASPSGAATRSTRRAGHGFISSQRMGMDVFAGDRPRRAARRRRGGLAVQPPRAGRPAPPSRARSSPSPTGAASGRASSGMLNINASLTKMGRAVQHDLGRGPDRRRSPTARSRAGSQTGAIEHDTSHVRDLDAARTRPRRRRRWVGGSPASSPTRMAILGVFDEGCMGMYNAIIDDEYLNPTGHLQGAPQPVRARRGDAPA